MNKIHTLPQEDRTNGWSAILPSRVPQPELRGENHFDWLVVGAGYAGLAAARQLAEHHPDESIALVDAGEVGENASGRNSGFAIDLPHSAGGHAQTVARAKREIRMGRQAQDRLRQIVQTYHIDCDWQDCGRYHVAVGERARRTVLAPYAHALRQWEEPHEILDRQALAERLGTDYYGWAIYTPGTALVNPAALSRGLADTLPGNVRLFERSPVIEHDLHGAKPSVKTPAGRIVAARAVLTVNAFSAQFGVYRNRQLPIVLFASLTEPLDARKRALLGAEFVWGATPANGVVGPTIRLTPDGRLLLRHGFEYSPDLRCDDATRDRARKRHLDMLMRRFPQLGKLNIGHFWMGWLSISRNHAPLFGRVSEHLWALACCNGVGIVRHTAAGLAIADLASGVDSEILRAYHAQERAAWLPPRPVLDAGVRLNMAWQKVAGREEA